MFNPFVSLYFCFVIYRITIEYKATWIPSVAVYLVVGYCLQYFIVNILSSKYDNAASDDHTLYTPLLTLCFLPLQMFQSGYCK